MKVYRGSKGEIFACHVAHGIVNESVEQLINYIDESVKIIASGNNEEKPTRSSTLWRILYSILTRSSKATSESQAAKICRKALNDQKHPGSLYIHKFLVALQDLSLPITAAVLLAELSKLQSEPTKNTLKFFSELVLAEYEVTSALVPGSRFHSTTPSATGTANAPPPVFVTNKLWRLIRSVVGDSCILQESDSVGNEFFKYLKSLSGGLQPSELKTLFDTFCDKVLDKVKNVQDQITEIGNKHYVGLNAAACVAYAYDALLEAVFDGDTAGEGRRFFEHMLAELDRDRTHPAVHPQPPTAAGRSLNVSALCPLAGRATTSTHAAEHIDCTTTISPGGFERQHQIKAESLLGQLLVAIQRSD